MFITNDYVLNGQGYGEIGQTLEACRFEPGLMRPYFDGRHPTVTINTGRPRKDKNGAILRDETGRALPEQEQVRVRDLMDNGIFSPVFNATTLRKDEWIQLDMAVLEEARARLRAWSDLAAANTFNVNGMGKSLLEHHTMADAGEALVDMDGLSEGRADRPLFVLEGLPLPITHSNFHFGERELMISRNAGESLDTLMARQAGRRVAEKIEQTLIGTVTGLAYGLSTGYGRTSQVYGLTNFAPRNTKTDMNAPTGSNGTTILTDWLALRDSLYDDNFFGPFMVYTSTDYDQYLDNLFSTTEPSAGTLRSRLLQIDGIAGIRRLDYLTSSTNPYTVLMVQMTPDVARAVIGMPIQTVQWESVGGMRKNFKVMTIMAPQLRADYDGRCGIAHGTTS